MVLTATSSVIAGTMPAVTESQESASVIQDFMVISANMVRARKYFHIHITVHQDVLNDK